MPIDILKTFPFRVRFHLGGEFNLLQWYTQGDGNHIILAKHEHLVTRVWTTVLKRHPDAETKEFYRIQIVSPPPAIAKKHAELAAMNERFSFKWKFTSPLKSYRDLKKKLPPKISLCKNPRDEDGKIIKKESEYDTGHYDCVNCIDGFLVEGHTFDTLYESLREKLFGEEYRNEKRKVSEAPPPVPKRVLYAVTEEPGHHRNGTGVEKMENWENPTEENHFPDKVHFFFQGEKLKVPAPITASIKAVNDAWEAQKKKSSEEHKASNKKFNDDLVKQVDNLLEGL